MGKWKLPLKLAGQKFGRLTVLFRVGISKKRHAIWHCKCDCGARCRVEGRHLVAKKDATRSCGCLARMSQAARNFRHGYSIPRTSPDPLYSKWCNLRCQEGKAVCAAWQDFSTFLEDMLALEWRPGAWLMRKDQSEPWNKENCVWANSKRRRALRQSYRDARGGDYYRSPETRERARLRMKRSLT